MTNTLYSLDALGTPMGFFLALLIGFGFGFALERAGFSSSRRLAGLFYFTDMAVLKVMFSALITAMLGLCYLLALGWITPDQLFFLPTIYGAQIIGGLIFGLGWGMLGYCPGTAVGATAKGRWDAFWGGALGMLVGAGIFSEVYPLLKDNLLRWGDLGKLTIPKVAGVNHWVIIAIVWIAFVLVLLRVEKKKP